MKPPVQLGVLALATGLVALSAAPALAAAPDRTAWYTALSVQGTALPAPTLADGDLRVAGTGSQPTAYATLALTSPGTAGGELVLAVRSGSVVGTPEVAACPTKSTSWEAGGDQPFEKGPGYDCAAGTVFGTLSADGTSISFPLDDTVQPAPGTLSIALAPLPDSTTPFSIDLGDPQYTPRSTAASAPAEQPAAPAASPAPAAAAPVPAVVPDAPAAPDALAQAPAPELAGASSALPADAPSDPATAAPLTEEPGAAAAPPGVLPVAQLAAQQEDTRSGPRLLALLTLVVVSAGAGYVAGQQRPGPRLLGGRAAAGVDTSLVVPEPKAAPLPRGIGRFSRVRDDAPRRLR